MSTKAVQEALTLGMLMNLDPAVHNTDQTIIRNLATRSKNQWKTGAHLMSQETWARSMGMTRQELLRAMKRLQHHGIVTVLGHDRPKGRGITTYQLTAQFVRACERWLKDVGKQVDRWWLRAEREGVKAQHWEDLLTAFGEPDVVSHWAQ